MIRFTKDEILFILKHINDNPAALLLRDRTFPADRMKELAAQLTARQKARQKLPAWYDRPELVFPPPLSVEQASSERTATYKASILKELSPEKPNLIIDLTGGMGVDALAFSRVAQRVIYTEQQPNLADLAGQNLPLLGGTNVEVHSGNGLEFIRNFEGRADWLYLDPARRDERGGKVVRLEDCEPSLPDWYSLLREKAEHILLKTSPLIDIEATRRTLNGVAAVHVVAVDNECKEVLFVLPGKSAEEDYPITAVNLRGSSSDELYTFRRSDERSVAIELGEPGQFLYEPNAAILKAGAFRSIAARYQIRKLGASSHLYTSAEPVAGFPGRSFRIKAICPPDRKALQALLPDRKASLTIRNFPETAENLRKKLGLTDGGTTYIFATTLADGNRRLLITEKTS